MMNLGILFNRAKKSKLFFHISILHYKADLLSTIFIFVTVDLMRVVQAPHMRLEVWPMIISPVIKAHS